MPGSTSRSRFAAARIRSAFLIQRADVYTDDPATGGFTVPVKSGLYCLLAPIGAGTAPSSAQRAELLASRQFYYEPGFDLPNGAQVSVPDPNTGQPQRWNVVANTQYSEFAEPDEAMYSVCDVRRVPPVTGR